jgi:glyoxylase-like metal-dependent hydrolase (beta-lactamase superfamily II)
MLIERSMSEGFLTNTYLVAADRGAAGFLIDAGGPMAPLFEAAERNEIDVTHVLLTHHHHDHVCDLEAVTDRYPDIVILAHPDEPLDAEPFAPLRIGSLDVDALHTPGHTKGMLNFTVPGHVFTGDTLFKNSIGGVNAPGSTSYADIKTSIMDTLMGLDPDTEVHPGHTDPTTIGEEWEHNAFIRLWRGLDEESTDRCRVGDEEAVLVLFAPDYDGGHKAWIRWTETGRDDIVPGSRVERIDGAE